MRRQTWQHTIALLIHWKSEGSLASEGGAGHSAMRTLEGSLGPAPLIFVRACGGGGSRLGSVLRLQAIALPEALPATTGRTSQRALKL